MSFVFCLAFGHWALAADWGEKRKWKKGRKKEGEKRRGPKGTKKRSSYKFSSAKSFFLLCSSPLHSFTRSFLLSFLDRVHRKTARARTHTHSHAHAPHALSQKPPFHFLWKSSSHPSVRLNANENFSLGFCFILLCVCVCVVLLPLSLRLCHERKGREMDRKKRGHSAPSSFSSLCRTLRLLTLSLVYICMNIQVSTHSQTKPTC